MPWTPPLSQRARWWLGVHATGVVVIVAAQVGAMSTSLALPIPVALLLQLLQGLGVLVGLPWSLAYLVPLVTPTGGVMGSAVVVGVPLLVNLAVHVAVACWVSRRWPARPGAARRDDDDPVPGNGT